MRTGAFVATRPGSSCGEARDSGHHLTIHTVEPVMSPGLAWIARTLTTIDPDDAHPKTGALSPSEDGAYFTAQLPTVADPVHLEIAVLKNRQWAALEFVVPVPFVSAKR